MLRNKFSIVFAVICLSKLAFGVNMNKYEELVSKIMPENPFFVQQFEENLKKLIEIEPNYFNYTPFKSNEFDCQKESDPTLPTSVHRLRPQDVKVVGALGDSLTAA